MEVLFKCLLDFLLHISRSFLAKINTECVSLLLQDIIEYDWMVKTGLRRNFLLESLEDVDGVRKQLEGKHSSRVWQILVKRVCTVVRVCN